MKKLLFTYNDNKLFSLTGCTSCSICCRTTIMSTFAPKYNPLPLLGALIMLIMLFLLLTLDTSVILVFSAVAVPTAATPIQCLLVFCRSAVV